MNLIIKSIIALCFTLLISNAEADRRADAMKIILQKLNDPSTYDKNVLPPSYSQPLDVYVTLLVRNMDLDDVNMKMNTDMTFRMQWNDERLKYSVRDVDDITLIDYEKLWIPDPFFKRSQNTKLQKTIHPEAFVRIKPDGTVLFSSRFIISSYCPMKFQRFPHDTQYCEIFLASYGYRIDDVKFSLQDSAIRMVSHPILSNRFMYKNHTYGPCHAETTTGEYSCIKATFTLSREFKSYLVEWYIPCMFYVIVAFFSEMIPRENLVPRLLLTMGPMLALAATSLTYRSDVPSVPYPTALDIFTGISMTVIFATLVHVVISYYRAVNPKTEEEEEKEAASVEEGKEETKKQPTKMEKLKRFLQEKSELVTRVVLMGFYGAFVFLYFAAYTI